MFSVFDADEGRAPSAQDLMGLVHVPLSHIAAYLYNQHNRAAAPTPKTLAASVALQSSPMQVGLAFI